MIAPVIQEELSGCGIAASAAILGKSYAGMKAIANAMGIHAEDETLWSSTDHVRRMLTSAGAILSPVETPFTSWPALPDLALLAIQYRQEEGRFVWHWVVFVRENGHERVLDSAAYLPANVRTDFAAMQPKWSIAVTLLGQAATT